MKKSKNIFPDRKHLKFPSSIIVAFFVSTISFANVSYIYSPTPEAQNSCHLCGTGGLMSYYSRFNSIGLMNINTGQIIDVPIFSFEDDGITPADPHGTIHRHVSSRQGSSIHISSGGYRRIGHIKIFPKEDVFFEKGSKVLCANCTDQVYETYDGLLASKIPDTVFVDFKDHTIYPIDRQHPAYFIRDYYLHFDFYDDHINILVLYAPEIPSQISSFSNQ